jgi:hypothetical protein
MFALAEPPCCLHHKGLKNKVNSDTGIVQAVAAGAPVSSIILHVACVAKGLVQPYSKETRKAQAVSCAYMVADKIKILIFKKLCCGLRKSCCS